MPIAGQDTDFLCQPQPMSYMALLQAKYALQDRLEASVGYLRDAVRLDLGTVDVWRDKVALITEALWAIENDITRYPDGDVFDPVGEPRYSKAVA